MVVAIFGESCTGKSTLADRLKGPMKAEVCTGRDYLRLAKDEAAAEKLFREKLEAAQTGDNLILGGPDFRGN